MGFFDKFKSTLSDVQKKASDGFKQLVDETMRTLSRNYFNSRSLLYPKYVYGNAKLYDFAYNSDVLTIIHKSLKSEIFRNGYNLEEAQDTDEEITSSEQESVAIGKSREDILNFLENVNENDQNIIDVCKEIEDDFNIVDDGYMIFQFAYGIGVNGEIVSKELKEVVRGDPRFMGLIMNKKDQPGMNDDGVDLNTCPEHRDQLIEGSDRCPVCGKKAYKAYFFGSLGTDKIYYFRNEVVHKSKFRPSKSYGFPPVITCWQKARTLMFMDQYVMDLYVNQRPPKAGLFFKTTNQEGLRKEWESAQQQAEEQPHLPIVMAIGDDTSGQNFVEFIDFMKPLAELQHTETRDEYRRQVGAIYGVMPIYESDMSNSGGLNNEGLQITVTNRAVEDDQYIFNTFYFPKLMDALGVSGWTLTLNPSEEQDEMAKLQRQQQTLTNGKLAMELGLEADYSSDTGEVVIKDGPLEKPETTNPFSPFGSNNDNNNPPAPNEPAKPSGSVNKSDESFFAKVIKEEIDKFTKFFEDEPTDVEMANAMGDIRNNLNTRLNMKMADALKEIYMRNGKLAADEIGIGFEFGQPDRNAIELLMNDEFLQESLSKFTKKLANDLGEIIKDAYQNPEGLSLPAIKNKIQEVGGFSDREAERIARNQTSQVSSAARVNSYKKSSQFNNYKFVHIGPNDSRTTSTSSRIKQRTKNGVSWDEYVQIVTEEAAKDFPTWTVNPSHPVSHWNSRHTFVRKV